MVSSIFLFSPRKLGKMNPFWRAYFSDALVQPPPRVVFGAHEVASRFVRIFPFLLGLTPVHDCYGSQLRIFVYDLPQLTQGVLHCHHGQWGLEVTWWWKEGWWKKGDTASVPKDLRRTKNTQEKFWCVWGEHVERKGFLSACTSFMVQYI